MDADERLRTLLRDPVRAAPELERRLRKQVHYNNGVLLIEDPIIHSVTTMPATIGWTISCDTLSVEVSFGDTSENGSGAYVQLTPIGIGANPGACTEISGELEPPSSD